MKNSNEKLNKETKEWMTNLQETHNINIVNHDVEAPAQLTDLQIHHIERVKGRINYFKAKKSDTSMHAKGLKATEKYVEAAKEMLAHMERTGETHKACAVVAMLDAASEIYVSTVRIAEEQYRQDRFSRRAESNMISLML